MGVSPTATKMSLVPLTAALGAEVFDLDLAAELEATEKAGKPTPNLATIIDAFPRYQVLVFRQQSIGREQHKQFGRLFGELHVHPSKRHASATGDREIFIVAADAETSMNNGGLWHSDVSCDEVPPLASLLLLKEAPPTGGDTLFANMNLAYETLSPPIKKMLQGLRAVHDQRQDLKNYGFEPRAGHEYPQSSHPIVAVHPLTGLPLLYVNPAFTTHIEGLSRLESRSLLDMLYQHVSGNPDIQCRVRWTEGTLTMWDNRAVQHYAVWDYRPAVRTGERVAVAGTVPPASWVAN